MTTESLYKKADRADDVRDLELDAMDAAQLVDTIYSSIKEGGYERGRDLLLSYKDKIRGTLMTSEMPSVATSDDHAVGDFLGVLLNKTRLEKLVVDKLYADKVTLGTGIPAGKTLVVDSCVYAEEIGKRARGGTVVNSSAVSKLGEEACGSFFMNDADCHSVGRNSRDSTFVNFHEIGLLGENAKHCTLIHYSGWMDLTFAGNYSCDSVVVVTSSTNIYSMSRARDVYYAGFTRLLFDRPLKRLVKDLRRAGTEKDPENAKDIARQIDTHVRANYKPRRVDDD